MAGEVSHDLASATTKVCTTSPFGNRPVANQRLARHQRPKIVKTQFESAKSGYLLRTNVTEKDPAKIWRWYIHLTQAEECFKISKSDLNLRPVFHQKEHRVEAHILICFLTLALWRTLEMWMRGKGLGNCARQLIKEVSTVKSMEVILPVKAEGEPHATELRLRVVARPDPMVAELLHHLGLKLPNAPKIVQNVVSKTTP